MNFNTGIYGNYGYQPQQYSYAPQPAQLPQQQILKVNGEPGAKSIRMGPNSSALALDETAPIVWVIATDGAGYATQTPYDISVHQQKPEIDMKSIEDRVRRLEELYAESYTRRTEKATEQRNTRSKTIRSGEFDNSNGQE